MDNNLPERSRNSIRALALTLHHLLIKKHVNYDLILSIGNSGLAMTKLSEQVYDILKVKFPRQISLPIYRYKKSNVYHSRDPNDWFDNRILLPQVLDNLNKLDKVDNILIVDDEIGLGISVGATIDLIDQALEVLNKFGSYSITIIAEDHAFKYNKRIPRDRAILYSIGEHIPQKYHIITYHIPVEFSSLILSNLQNKSKRIGPRQIHNILLDVPIKKRVEGEPMFTNKYNKIAEETIPNLRIIRKEYNKHIKQLVTETLSTRIQKRVNLDNYQSEGKIQVWKIFNNSKV